MIKVGPVVQSAKQPLILIAAYFGALILVPGAVHLVQTLANEPGGNSDPINRHLEIKLLDGRSLPPYFLLSLTLSNT